MNVARAVLLVLLAVGLIAWPPSAMQSPASPSAVDWPQIRLVPYAGGLASPVHITHAGDGSGRLFVVEQGGIIKIIRNGVVQPTPFLNISSRVSCCGERGLLSIAFPPGYAGKGYFYVNYTDRSGDTVVARYRLTANPDVADENSEQIIIHIDQPYDNHNGGQIAFGPRDSFLYIGMGDGGAGGDPQNRAQNPQELLGKILRIDVETGSPLTYTVPSANPFTQTAGFRPEIWALGLRNPWRFAFDRQTADLYIGDVGQDTYEEIDVQPAASAGGENYGWKIMEGFHCYNTAACNSAGLVLPVVEYNHNQGCSVTGGLVYRGAQFSRMQGIYFFGDFCSRRLWGLKHDGTAWQNVVLINNTGAQITSFGEDEAGNLYLTNYGGGSILRVTDDNATPTATRTATRTPTVTPTWIASRHFWLPIIVRP